MFDKGVSGNEPVFGEELMQVTNIGILHPLARDPTAKSSASFFPSLVLKRPTMMRSLPWKSSKIF